MDGYPRLMVALTFAEWTGFRLSISWTRMTTPANEDFSIVAGREGLFQAWIFQRLCHGVPHCVVTRCPHSLGQARRGAQAQITMFNKF